MYRRGTSAAGRSAIPLVAVYAFLLNTLLSAAAPFVPASSPDANICIDHAGGPPDQPSGPASAHENSWCVAMFAMGLAALPPSYSSRVSLTRPDIFSVTY